MASKSEEVPALDAHLKIVKKGIDDKVEKAFDEFVHKHNSPEARQNMQYTSFEGIKGKKVDGGTDALFNSIYQNAYKDIAKQLDNVSAKKPEDRDKAVLGILEAFILPSLEQTSEHGAQVAAIYKATKKEHKSDADRIDVLYKHAERYLGAGAQDERGQKHIDKLRLALASEDKLAARQGIAEFRDTLKQTVPGYHINLKLREAISKAGVEGGEDKFKAYVTEQLRKKHTVEPDYPTYHEWSHIDALNTYQSYEQAKDPRSLKFRGLKQIKKPDEYKKAA